MEKRTRVAGIVRIENSFLLMHRRGVSYKTPSEYYTFPGGGLEDNETIEEGIVREIKEEFNVDVEVIKKLYYIEKEDANEYFYLCKYIKGDVGKGTGPEFSDNEEYKFAGEYLPELVNEKEIKKLILMPPDIKEKFLEDLEKGLF